MGDTPFSRLRANWTSAFRFSCAHWSMTIRFVLDCAVSSWPWPLLLHKLSGACGFACWSLWRLHWAGRICPCYVLCECCTIRIGRYENDMIQSPWHSVWTTARTPSARPAQLCLPGWAVWPPCQMVNTLPFYLRLTCTDLQCGDLLRVHAIV